METSHVARSERSPLRIGFAENEPEGARTEGSGDGEMKYRRATIVADDWHGEFGSYDEWARLGPQPPYRAATFFDAQGRRCITEHDFARARDDRAYPQCPQIKSSPPVPEIPFSVWRMERFNVVIGPIGIIAMVDICSPTYGALRGHQFLENTTRSTRLRRMSHFCLGRQ